MRIEFKRLKKLKNRYLSGKGAILFLLNRKVAAMVGADFGELTDLHLDRAAKNMVLEIRCGLDVNTIAINGYGVVNRQGKPFLTWNTTQIEGPDRERYMPIFQRKEGIELTKRYAAVVEAIL